MKKLLLIIALVISSCTEVRFQEAQPPNAPAITEFPKKMQGLFASEDDDTLLIENNSFTYFNGKEINVTGPLSSSGEVILKKFGNKYILNIKDNESWDVYPLQVSRNRIKAGYAVLDEKTEQFLRELEKSAKVKRVNTDDRKFSHYVVSPSEEDFKKLMKKNLFSEKVIFKRIKQD